MKTMLFIMIFFSSSCLWGGSGIAQENNKTVNRINKYTKNISVDFGKTIGPALQRGSGVLHAIELSGPPENLILPLKISLFRGRWNDKYLRNPKYYERLKHLGIKHIQIPIVDNWFKASPEEKGQEFPGDKNWDTWEMMVEKIVQETLEQKCVVEYDIWNEPGDTKYFWPRPQSQYYETWRRAYVKIRSVNPKAEIVGPSCHYRENNFQFLKNFLLYAKKNNCLPDILSWHEIGLPDKDGRNVSEHVKKVREFMNANDIDISRISLNEIVTSAIKYNPGALVGFFAEIERAKVESAAHSAWVEVAGKYEGGCNSQSLNHLLTAEWPKKPRSTWWAHKCYADITGQIVQVSRENRQAKGIIDGIAGYDREKQMANIVIGRYDGGDRCDVKLICRNLDKAEGLITNGQVYVKAMRIPASQRTALEKPLSIIDKKYYTENDNSITIILPDFGPQAVYAVQISKIHNTEK